MSDELRADLVNKLKQDPKSVVFVVGAGVTIGALHGAGKPTSWWDLIKDGLDFAATRSKIKPDEREECISKLDAGDSDDWIEVAQTLTDNLGGPQSGTFRRWLRESVGAFHESIQDRSVLGPLAELAKRGALLLTTNYDHVLEEVTGQPTVVGTDSARVGDAVRGKSGILHVHGSWDRPESVVLGAKSYQVTAGDDYLQHIMRVLPVAKTLVFVGCGAGLADPNWGPFLAWVQDKLASDPQEHYRLCREGERYQVAEEPGPPIVPLVYGKKHEELGGFLQGLVSELPALPVEEADVTRFGLLVNIGRPRSEDWRFVTRQELLHQIDAPNNEEPTTFEVVGEYEHTSDAVWQQVRRDIDSVVRKIDTLVGNATRKGKVELHIAGRAWPSVWGYLGSALQYVRAKFIIHHVHGDEWTRIGPEQVTGTTDPKQFKPILDIRQKDVEGVVSIGVNCSERAYQDFHYPQIRELIMRDGDSQIATYTINQPGKMNPKAARACLSGILETLQHPRTTGYTLGFAGPTWVLFWLGQLVHRDNNIDFLHFRGLSAKGQKYEYALSTSRERRIRGTVRVLFVGAQPEDQTSVEVIPELEAIRGALANASPCGSGVKLESLLHATRGGLLRKLESFKPHIVHISCHGEADKLALIGVDGQANVVRGQVLAEYLTFEKHRPELVFISACHSSSLADELSDKVRVMLTYPGVANVRSSRVFTKSFYTHLRRGTSVEQAVAEANRDVDEHLPQNDPCNRGARCEVIYGVQESGPIHLFRR